jgi:hypothetical protein
MEVLLRRYPELLSSEDGVRLVAHTHWWLPPSVLTTIFDTWCSAQWVIGPQAAGEVIVLRYAQMPEDAWTTERLAILLTCSEKISESEWPGALRTYGVTRSFATRLRH